jgi:hypothetical protein
MAVLLLVFLSCKSGRVRPWHEARALSLENKVGAAIPEQMARQQKPTPGVTCER